MTTNFTVVAHCGDGKEVKIVIKEDGESNPDIFLQDGEELECCVYDSRIVAVREVEKNVTANSEQYPAVYDMIEKGYFNYQHLPEKLAEISRPFSELALKMDRALVAGSEKSSFFRKLLEAKDCAVRAAL